MSELTPDEVRRRRLARLGTSAGGLPSTAESSSKAHTCHHPLAKDVRGIIKRNFIHFSSNTFIQFIQLYKSIVRPHLDYANSVWHQCKVGDIEDIEQVQQELGHHRDEKPERDLTYHLTCLLIYHGTTTHL